MEQWKQDRLIDILDTLIDYRGKTPNKVECGIPLITAKIVKNGRIETPTEFLTVEDYKDWMVRGYPQMGDVVITTEAPLGEVAQLRDDKIALAQRIVCLRGKEGVLDNTYLKYFLMSNIGQYRLKARETGTTVTGIKQSELKEVLIDYPNYELQQKIASILSSFDSKIELNRRINDNLEQQAQALFKSWFVDFEPFGGSMPDSWEICEAQKYFKINIGKTPPRNETKCFSQAKTDCKWASISDLGKCGLFISDTSEYLTKEAVDAFNIIIVPTGTVLLSFKLTLGRTAITTCPLTTNEAIARFLVKYDYEREYLYLFLKHYDYTSLGNTSSIATAVNSKIIKSMPIIMPSIDVLQQFHNVVKPLFNKILSLTNELVQLAETRDAILPKLMSGELKIDKIEI